MSALIAVHARDRIHLLTDGAALARHDGTLVEIRQKQTVCPNNGVAVASIGKWPRAKHFAEMADEWLKDFDAVIDAALDLWAETRTALHASDQDVRCMLVLAGFSAKAGKLSMWAIDENGKLVEAGVVAAGPTTTCGEVVHGFIKRFSPDPAKFTGRDGVECMERLRREHPRTYATGMRHAVGAGS